MFQPQATPYSASFPSYGAGNSVNYAGILPSSSAGGSAIAYSGGPTVFEDRVFPPSLGALNFTHQQQQTQRQHPHHQLPLQHNNNKMSEHDLRAQELAAQDYERENRVQGPMVGEKKSSHAITEEYAKADPVYVAKTIALPQKYSHYRPIAGDGNCGWRAAGFSYFECLIRSQSRSQVEEEIARITSLNNMLTTIGGIEQWLVEDMTEESMSLLRDLAGLVEGSSVDATEILYERFNDPAISLSIIYHLRLLASAWLAANPDEYAGFIPDGLGVLGYRKNCLEVVNTEIEHLGMTLLIDVLIKPIGITVEIVMLDRSEGSQANSHIFQSEDSNGLSTSRGGPIIHLLYRPSHYDILYKDTFPIQNHQIKAEMSHYSNLQVNRAHSLPQQHHQNSANDMAQFSSIDINNSPLLDIPGYSLPLMPQAHNYTGQYQPLDTTFAPSPLSTSMSPILSSSTQDASLTNNMPSPYLQQQNTLAIRQSHNVLPYHSTSNQLPIHTSHTSPTSPHPHQLKTSQMMHRNSVPTTHSPPIKQELVAPVSTPNSFRPSHYQYAANANERHEPVICQTTTFKNSHFNTAHYLNPDFQPEEWTPESEERRGSN